MTRELKFRAWGKNIKEYMGDGKGDCNVVNILGDLLKQGGWIIEQYTGLKDKTGKEIYEGDIIEVETCIDEEEITTYEVYWDGDTLEYALRIIKGINYDSCVGELSPSSVRVIGNIHEYPIIIK